MSKLLSFLKKNVAVAVVFALGAHYAVKNTALGIQLCQHVISADAVGHRVKLVVCDGRVICFVGFGAFGGTFLGNNFIWYRGAAAQH